MRKMLFGAAVVALVALAAADAGAQESTVKVKVPFPFEVEHQLLPAGDYVVEQAGPDVLLIRGEHGTKGSANVLARLDSPLPSSESRPILTFTKDETQWRLASVDEPGIGENMVVSGVSLGN